VDDDELTYAPVGGTRRRTGHAWTRADVPPGYRPLRARHLLVAGGDETARATLAADLRTWRVHRAAGIRVRTDGPVRPGRRVVTLLGIGPAALRTPCRVVWADAEGFGYGTLPGHFAAGEEAFRVVRRAGDVWLEVEAYSRPVRPWARALAPVVPLGQALYVRLLAHAARRIHRRRGVVH